MGSALFIVLEKELPGIDTFVNGKALAKAENILDEIASQLNIRSLMSFFSVSEEMVLSTIDEVDAEEELIKLNIEPEKWFAPSEGLNTIRELLIFIQNNPGSIDASDFVIKDLKEFEAVLSEAEKHKISWHLEIDF